MKDSGDVNSSMFLWLSMSGHYMASDKASLAENT